MHPIHDVDVILLLALALSSKRRPAELVEIVSAVDLLQGETPSESRFGDSFKRLSVYGLISETEGCFSLAPEAQKIMSGQSRKADTEQRIQSIRDKLSAYEHNGECSPILVSQDNVRIAILAHRKAAKVAGKNLLVPKLKAAEAGSTAPGQRQRKPLPANRRKS